MLVDSFMSFNFRNVHSNYVLSRLGNKVNRIFRFFSNLVILAIRPSVFCELLPNIRSIPRMFFAANPKWPIQFFGKFK